MHTDNGTDAEGIEADGSVDCCCCEETLGTLVVYLHKG